MKYVDRLTDRQLAKLPDEVMPGRYCLTEDLWFNDHSQILSGEILLDDGSGVFRDEHAEHKFLVPDMSNAKEADAELSTEAILAIAEKINYAPGKVSPMLPSELAAQSELEEIEIYLQDVLDKGHLHSISDRPRRDLRYEDLVAPVGRARRLATSALSHLASHSDCWQQRTLTGILPRKVLARFSEDDNAIYENRLYKRLLDRLERHLEKRLTWIEGVNCRLEKALEFQNSKHTHFLLRDRICSLWGESYQSEERGKGQLDIGRRAVNKLKDQLRSIRGLKQRGLYTLVPAFATVPTQVHRTNILNHDPHYRHLPPLWELLGDEREERQLRPEERLAHQQQLQLAYVNYVGLVLRRSLERYGIRFESNTYNFLFAGQKFAVDQYKQAWYVKSPDGIILKFVPIAWFGDENWNMEKHDPSTILCWLGCAKNGQSSQGLSISPLDLYVVERMGRLIDEWLMNVSAGIFAKPLGPFPTSVKRLVDGWSGEFLVVSATHAKLISPLDKQKLMELRKALNVSKASPQVINNVENVIQGLDVLTRCRCGHQVVLTWDQNCPNDFYCQCKSCQLTWFLKSTGNKRHFYMRPKGSKDIGEVDGFAWAGRDWLDFDVSV